MPQFFSGFSIRTKLTAIILFAVLPSVLIFSLFIIYLASTSLKQAAVEETKTLVRALNQDFIKLLLVNTPDIGADSVSRLRQFKHIKDVVLYDKKNNVVFVYQAEEAVLPSVGETPRVWFDKDELYLLQAVTHHNKQYGDVYFRVSLDNLTFVLSEFYQANIIAIPFVFLFSLCMALLFQRHFSRPIITLSDVMQNITKSKDYSVRVPIIKSKEMGILYAGFNNMLDLIQNSISTIRKNKARLAHAQKIAHLGYWEYDLQENRFIVSEGICEILNLKVNTPSPKEILKLIDPKDRKKVLQLIKAAKSTGQSSSTELKFEISKKKALYAYGTVERRHDNLQTKQYLFGVVQDVTERYENEELTRQALLEKQKADSENHAKSTFLANMSHELRTPLNAIIGYSEIIKEDAIKSNQSELVEDSENIHTAGTYLLSLIKNVLDLSKIEADKMDIHYEDISLREMINNVAVTLKPLLDNNGNQLTVKFNDDINTIETDTTKLRQVLFNLLGNANKFTSNGDLMLEVWQVTSKEQGWFYIQISDSGIGITSTQISKLFQPFVQADSTTTKNFGGTGLGLTISKRFCELLGGTIEVESEPGKGSTFTIRLPITKSKDLPINFQKQAAG